MTDAEYLFRQTEIERKRAGYGDRHKKRQGGRHVRLPSDHRTKKELAAMNGEVKTYKDKPFYTRDEFLELPDDLRIKWVNSLINRYDVSVKSISSVCFGDREWLRQHIIKSGFGEYINKGPRGRAACKGLRELETAYHAFVNGPETPQAEQELAGIELHTPEPETLPAAVMEPENAVDEQSEREKLGIDSIVALVAALQSLTGTGVKLTIEVTL